VTLLQLGALTLLGAIWGASFIFIRVAVEPFGPVFLMLIRVVLASILLFGYAKFRGVKLEIRPHWRKFLVLGSLSSAIPFVLIGWSELTITGSMAAILNSTTPLFATGVAAIFLGERLTIYKVIGALMGIIGVIFIVGGSPITFDTMFILATLASLGAAFCYALGGVYAKRAFAGVDNMSMSTGQMIGATVVLTPVSVVNIPHEVPPTDAILALLGLAIFATAIAYRLYFYLIISAGPTKALTVTLLVPVFGVIWGAMLLNEPISSGMLIGLVIILLSVGLVTGMISPQKSPALKPSEG
jgi:drug/metabolite transporter (DMT)-like permease